MAKKHKRKKTPREAPPQMRLCGFGSLFLRALKRFFLPVPVALAFVFASAGAASFWGAPFAYAVYCAAAAALAASVIVPCVAEASFIAHSEEPFSCVDAKKRAHVKPGTAALSCFAAAAAASVVSALAIFASAAMLTSVIMSFAASMSFLSAVLYLSLSLAVTAAAHEPKGRRGRRRFILGFLGLYAIGLVVLIFILAATSSLPLGEDFIGVEEIPAGTLAGLSAIYLLSTALRAVYLYFILRARFRASGGHEKRRAGA